MCGVLGPPASRRLFAVTASCRCSDKQRDTHVRGQFHALQGIQFGVQRSVRYPLLFRSLWHLPHLTSSPVWWHVEQYFSPGERLCILWHW